MKIQSANKSCKTQIPRGKTAQIPSFKLSSANAFLTSSNEKVGQFTTQLTRNFGDFQKNDTVDIDLRLIKKSPKNPYDYLYATTKKDIIARAQFRKGFPAIELFTLKNWHSDLFKGVGTAIMQYFTELSLNNGSEIYLHAIDHEKSPVGFYYKLGFRAKDHSLNRIIAEDIANTGTTVENDILMKSTAATVEFFRDRILKNPFIKSSIKRLKIAA